MYFIFRTNFCSEKFSRQWIFGELSSRSPRHSCSSAKLTLGINFRTPQFHSAILGLFHEGQTGGKKDKHGETKGRMNKYNNPFATVFQCVLLRNRMHSPIIKEECLQRLAANAQKIAIRVIIRELKCVAAYRQSNNRHEAYGNIRHEVLMRAFPRCSRPTSVVMWIPRMNAGLRPLLASRQLDRPYTLTVGDMETTQLHDYIVYGNYRREYVCRFG
jgi:hypothetical protein